MTNLQQTGDAIEADVVVVGSGVAALTAALRAAVGGLSVVIAEKTEWLGGTSAMSGAALWVPANHLAADQAIEDTQAEALEYLRATAPAGWRETEDELWQALVRYSPEMLTFIERHTPLRFALTGESDVFVEAPGGKKRGRMLSPLPLRRRIAGPYALRLRPSTLPHLFTYHETSSHDLYRRPLRTVLALAPRLLMRMLTGAAAKGTALTAGLVKGCLDHGCRIELQTRAMALIREEGGAITGVTADQRGRTMRLAARRGVVLAAGGFEWDGELVSEHFPGALGLGGSPRANDGDAIRMGLEIGAQLAHMDQALIFPCVPTRYEGRVHSMPLPFQMEPNAIVVDRSGRRFTSEAAVDLGEALDRRDRQTGEPLHAPAWFISEAALRRPVLQWYGRHVPGWIRKASSIEGLARAVGLPPDSLTETVRRFNAFCRQGRDEDFRRGETFFERSKFGGRPVLLPIERPPFIAIPFERCILSTKGGLRTDARGRVLHRDGHAIKGLYCAGAAMANPIGTRAISAGTTLGPNATWGYICASEILAGLDTSISRE